jgi:hypothetical protein
MISTPNAFAQTPTVISSARIEKILDYVIPSERCVLDAAVYERSIQALIKFQSPRYTKHPVEYLSSSVLAISLAQTAHILADVLVELGKFPYPSRMTLDYLAQIRNHHEMYFIELDCRFRERHPAKNYSLTLELLQSRRVADLSIHKLNFNVGTFITGKCLVTIPLLKGAAQEAL